MKKKTVKQNIKESQAAMGVDSLKRMKAFDKYNSEMIKRTSTAPSLFTQIKQLNVQPGWNNPQPKKKRIPTRFNAKKLKEKHKDLWTSIARKVAFDMTVQKDTINSDKAKTCCPIGHLSLRFTETVSENAAFTAIVEMIKRGLL